MDDPRGQRVLRQHVKTDQLMGVDAVPRGTPPGPADASPRAAAGAPHIATHRGGAAALSEAPAAPAAGGVKLVPLDRDTRLRILEAIDEGEVRGCTKCALHEGRTHTVFGEGDPDADILFIGEGPGADEDEQGRPFVGRSGALLDKMIAAMGVQRRDVYIANVVKCRPPGNRAPTPAEAEVCAQYLRRQIATIQPKAIVTLGGPAAKLILGKDGVTRLRGNWHRYDGTDPPIPVMPTFHPSYVLRRYTKEVRGMVWSDLQAVMQRIGAS